MVAKDEAVALSVMRGNRLRSRDETGSTINNNEVVVISTTRKKHGKERKEKQTEQKKSDHDASARAILNG